MQNTKTSIEKKMHKKLTKPAMDMPMNEVWKGWKKKLFIGVPSTGLVRMEWVMGRFGQVIPVNWANSDLFYFYSQYSPTGWAVADARNICIQESLNGGFEWTLFIDHDVILPPDTFLKMNKYMRETKYPVVCGLYFCKGSHPEPLLFRGRGTSFYSKWKRGDKILVDGIPMGCTLIHNSIMRVLYDKSEVYSCATLAGPKIVRRVFETPRDVWRDPQTGAYNTKVGTEDMFWCDRIMKEKAFELSGEPKFKKFQKKKYPFLVDTSIFCQHIDENGIQYPANVGVR